MLEWAALHLQQLSPCVAIEQNPILRIRLGCIGNLLRLVLAITRQGFGFELTPEQSLVFDFLTNKNTMLVFGDNNITNNILEKIGLVFFVVSHFFTYSTKAVTPSSSKYCLIFWTFLK